VESEIRKDCKEEIEVCLHCERLLEFQECEYTVKVKCTAVDRFDCPRLRRFYSKEELDRIDRWKKDRGIGQTRV